MCIGTGEGVASKWQSQFPRKAFRGRPRGAQGFHSIETDCQLSADGIPVVIHGEHLGKTTNGSGTCPANHNFGCSVSWCQWTAKSLPSLLSSVLICSLGLVSGHSAAELQRLDAGAWHSLEYAGQHVPLLSEVLDLLTEAHLHLVRVPG